MEAQALLRARGMAGSVKLIDAFTLMADRVRYPARVSISRPCARSSASRHASRASGCRRASTRRGTSSSRTRIRSSDVEWLVQLLQLQHAHAVPAMRTTSTLGALQAAREAGLIAPTAADRLAEAWRLASRLRSANTLLSGQTSDVLPVDRNKLDGIGRLLEYAPRSATQVEEEYLGTTRRARRVFEALYG